MKTLIAFLALSTSAFAGDCASGLCQQQIVQRIIVPQHVQRVRVVERVVQPQYVQRVERVQVVEKVQKVQRVQRGRQRSFSLNVQRSRG